MDGTGQNPKAKERTDLEALRRGSGFSSVRKFEKAFGIDKGKMSRWERCKEKPFPDERDRLGEIFGKKPRWWVTATVEIELELPERVLEKR